MKSIQIPISTIHYTIKQQNQRGDNRSNPRSGRPNTLSAEEKHRIIDLAENDKNVKMRELSQAVESNPSIHTVQRLLRTHEAKKSKQCEHPEITPEYAENAERDENGKSCTIDQPTP